MIFKFTSAEQAFFGPEAELVTEAFTVESFGDIGQGEENIIPIGLYRPVILRAFCIPKVLIEGRDHDRGVDYLTTPRRGYVQPRVNGMGYGHIDLRALSAGRWFELEPNQLLIMPPAKLEFGFCVSEPCESYTLEISVRITTKRESIHG